MNLVDCDLIANGEVQVEALSDEYGVYRCQRGWNVNTPSAAGIGMLFSSILPNFTHVRPDSWGSYGWFFRVAIAGAAYGLRSMVMPRSVPAIPVKA